MVYGSIHQSPAMFLSPYIPLQIQTNKKKFSQKDVEIQYLKFHYYPQNVFGHYIGWVLGIYCLLLMNGS